MVPDDEMRQTMMWIVEQVNRVGQDWVAISNLMVKERIMWKRRSKKARAGFEWEFWHRNKVQLAYHRMVEIMAAENAKSPGDQSS